MKKINDVKKISQRSHILLRPGMYIGNIKTNEVSKFIFNFDKKQHEFKNLSINSGLLKIIYEILDNSIDIAVKMKYKSGNKIDVSINSDSSFTISDNGEGILIKKDDSGIYTPELAFAHAHSGSNFDEKQQSIGMNGVGAFLTNVYSKWFSVVTCDGKNKFTLDCLENCDETKTKTKIEKSNRRGTIVSFLPDYEKFNLTDLDLDHIEIIKQRLIHLSVCYPEISFTLNKKEVSLSLNDYLNSFNPDYTLVKTENISISVSLSTTDQFEQVSIINGLDVELGGAHIEYIHSELVQQLKDKFPKKYDIKSNDIKSKLLYVVIVKNFQGMEFDSQTKQRITNSLSDVKTLFSEIDWPSFVNKVWKNKQLVDKIIEEYKLKIALKNSKELNAATRQSKKIRCENYIEPIGSNQYFVITEGLSAMSSLVDSLGRQGFGYFASRGVPLNVLTSSIQKLIGNEELMNISKILGLKFGEKDDNSIINYDKIVIGTDADCDGSHIVGLYLGFFFKYAKELLKSGRICKLNTPIVVAKNASGKILKWIFSLEEYQDFSNKNQNKNIQFFYKKGLGSWKKEEFKQMIQEVGLSRIVVPFTFSEEDDTAVIEGWLKSENSDVRKALLVQTPFELFYT